MNKTCSKCGAQKPLTEFFNDKGFSGGKMAICKSCKVEQTYEWRKENRKKYNDLAKKWRQKNPDRAYASEIKRRYGCSADKYQTLLEAQNYKCAICDYKHNPKKLRGRLYVDHCHGSKEIRGLLCSGCNSGLGYFNDNQETLKSAIQYLAKQNTL